MAITKEIIRECMITQREIVDSVTIVERPYVFADGVNYVLVGVRHVGKSYLLYQRIRQLLQQGYSWNDILLINFDDERLAEMTTNDLNLLIETHSLYSNKRPIIFFDEIQRVPHWDMFVRRLADSKHTIYITGSNAKMLSSEVATTLGGRFLINEVYPFSFSEFITAKNICLDKDWLYSTKQRSLVQRAYFEYVAYGGLPEILSLASLPLKRTYLSSLYQKIYLGDICARHNIGDIRVLNILIKKLAESVKQPQSFRRLHHIVTSTGSKISLPTIISYVDYIEAAWLVIPTKNHIAQLAEKESIEKHYFIDNGILNLFLSGDTTTLLENIVALDLFRRYGKDNVSYIHAGNEIDFIIESERMALQVTYDMSNEETRNRELAPLAKFQSQHSDWTCLVVTHDDSQTYLYAEQSIRVVPAYQWLLRE